MADGDISSKGEAASLAGVCLSKKPWQSPQVRKFAEPPADTFEPENEG